ncbi:hypothetical protein RDI58_010339 [Solanum bulbocastanum]|uniref:Uncharacterized protein n=1 Tax=Solanum bulbocastanum TaxID=147425 RepID=A0AAN8TUS9_SOLBU
MTPSKTKSANGGIYNISIFYGRESFPNRDGIEGLSYIGSKHFLIKATPYPRLKLETSLGVLSIPPLSSSVDETNIS